MAPGASVTVALAVEFPAAASSVAALAAAASSVAAFAAAAASRAAAAAGVGATRTGFSYGDREIETRTELKKESSL